MGLGGMKYEDTCHAKLNESNWDNVRACFVIWVSQVAPNKRRYYICNVFSYWLRFCSAIDRKCTLVIPACVDMTIEYVLWCFISTFWTWTLYKVTSITISGVMQWTLFHAAAVCELCYRMMPLTAQQPPHSSPSYGKIWGCLWVRTLISMA